MAASQGEVPRDGEIQPLLQPGGGPPQIQIPRKLLCAALAVCMALTLVILFMMGFAGHMIGPGSAKAANDFSAHSIYDVVEDDMHVTWHQMVDDMHVTWHQMMLPCEACEPTGRKPDNCDCGVCGSYGECGISCKPGHGRVPCKKAVTCRGFSCGPGWKLRVSANHHTCASPLCRTSECCYKVTCDSHECGHGWVNKPNRSIVQCPEAHCTEEACCVKKNMCTCTKGTPATGPDCTSNGAEICESCDAGFHLNGNSCLANTCSCTNGAAASGKACTSNGAELCTSCESGFYPTSGNLCHANACSCTGGTAAMGPDCKSDGDEICRSCDTGFHLIGNSCHANAAKTTTTSTSTTISSTTTTTTTTTTTAFALSSASKRTTFTQLEKKSGRRRRSSEQTFSARRRVIGNWDPEPLQVSCFESDVKYEPLDMPGQQVSLEAKDAESCQARCARVNDCAHFSFWPAFFRHGGCHLQDSSSSRTQEAGVTAGPKDCSNSKPKTQSGGTPEPQKMYMYNKNYLGIVEGTCASYGWAHITDETTCKQAVKGAKTVTVVFDVYLPQGCSFLPHSGQLTLNRKPTIQQCGSRPGQVCLCRQDSHTKSLCSSVLCPANYALRFDATAREGSDKETCCVPESSREDTDKAEVEEVLVDFSSAHSDGELLLKATIGERQQRFRLTHVAASQPNAVVGWVTGVLGISQVTYKLQCQSDDANEDFWPQNLGRYRAKPRLKLSEVIEKAKEYSGSSHDWAWKSVDFVTGRSRSTEAKKGKAQIVWVAQDTKDHSCDELLHDYLEIHQVEVRQMPWGIPHHWVVMHTKEHVVVAELFPWNNFGSGHNRIHCTAWSTYDYHKAGIQHDAWHVSGVKKGMDINAVKEWSLNFIKTHPIYDISGSGCQDFRLFGTQLQLGEGILNRRSCQQNVHVANCIDYAEELLKYLTIEADALKIEDKFKSIRKENLRAIAGSSCHGPPRIKNSLCDANNLDKLDEKKNEWADAWDHPRSYLPAALQHQNIRTTTWTTTSAPTTTHVLLRTTSAKAEQCELQGWELAMDVIGVVFGLIAFFCIPTIIGGVYFGACSCLCVYIAVHSAHQRCDALGIPHGHFPNM